MILENMTMADVTRNLKKSRPLIIPFGTVEEHGRHLPLNTDTLIIYEILKKVSAKTGTFLAPPVYYGVCTSTDQFPGTISITPSTLRRITYDLGKNAFEKGFRNIFLITGHGGGLHTAAMKESAERRVAELNGLGLAVIRPYEILYKELFALA